MSASRDDLDRALSVAYDEIDKLKAEIERLKGGQGERISFPRDLGDGLAELIATKARVCGGGAFDIWEEICEQFGTSQPAPVSVVLPTSTDLHKWCDQSGYDGSRDIAHYIWSACTDKVKELNQ